MTTMTQTEIREIAESLIEATPAETIAIKELVLSLPGGEKLHEAISAELINIAREQVTTSIGEAFSELLNLAKEEEAEEEKAAELIRAQLEQEKLHVHIAKQLQEQKLAQSIREQVDASKVDLSSLIKEQITEKNLSDLINEQLEDMSLKGVIAEDIIDTIVDEILEANDYVEGTLSLHPRNISFHATVFKSLFEDIAYENGIKDIEYDDKYTVKIMLGMVEGLVEKGAELSFRNEDGEVFPVLVME